MQIRNTLTRRLNDREQRALERLLEDIRNRELPAWLTGHLSGSQDFDVKISDETFGNSPRRELLYGREPNGRYHVIVSYGAIEAKATALDLTERRGSSFEAMFYPNASMSASLLKLALIYFDRVFILFPDETTLSPAASKSGRGALKLSSDGEHSDFTRVLEPRTLDAEWDRLVTFFNETIDLRREGVLQFLSPGQTPSKELSQSIGADLGDPGYVKMVDELGLSHMYLAGSKMPRGIEDAEKALKRRDFSTAVRLLLENSWSLDWGRHYGQYKLSPTLGASILLSHALVCCSQHGLAPLTDDSKWEALMFRKLFRGSGVGQPAFRKQNSLASSSAAIKILERYVPNIELAQYPEILECRHSLRDGLIAFRKAMVQIVGKAKLTGELVDLQSEVEKILDTEVQPAIDDIDRKLRSTRLAFLQRLVKGAKVGAIPLIATAIAGMPVEYMLAISAGVLTVDALIDTVMERRSIRDASNGLSYVLDLRRKIA